MSSCQDIQGYCTNIVRKGKEGFYWVHGENVHQQTKRRTYCDFVNDKQGMFGPILTQSTTTVDRIIFHTSSDPWKLHGLQT